MKLRILVEVIADGKAHRRMTSIEIPKKRVKLIETFHGDNSIEFMLDEALTGATGAFQAQKKAEAVDPSDAPKEKLEEVLGLDIINEMDRRERAPGPGGAQKLPPLPRVGAPQAPNPIGPGPLGFGRDRGR